MSVISNIKEWFEHVSSQAKVKKILKRKKLMENECCRNFQIMEFEGKIYICYENIPVVRIEDLKKSPTEILEQSREDFVKFQNKFGMR